LTRALPSNGGNLRAAADLAMDVSGTISAVLAQKGSSIYSIAPNATVADALQMMDARNVGALLVVGDSKLVGIISERDYTRKVFLRGKRSRETLVEEIMSTDLTLTSPSEPVENCLRMMTDKRIRHLPVVEDGKLVGIISIGDLVKHVISCQSATIAHLENYISGGYSA
jgi:Predicted signal-transduction protein containing cAMP-binding and CBS domains